jgi:GPH family glycoside/pentoside/hexuronide:cation symporter
VASGGLSTRAKFLYGLGDWGTAAASTARNIFWFVFLTNVVGLNAGWAGSVVLIGRIWDSINDPLIGTLSDRVHTRWGRRRPFLLIGSVPFAVTFVAMFTVPDLDSDRALFAYYSLVFLLFDTLFTIVNVPYLALLPELTDGYDERSSLAGWRISFSILASLITAGLFKVFAENIFAPLFGGGAEGLQRGYTAAAVLWAITIALPFILLFLFVREPERAPVVSPIRPVRNFIEVFHNEPFRIAAFIYLICFTTGDIILVIFVRYLIDYLLVPPGFDNIVLAVVLGSAFAFMPLIVWLMRRYDKRTAYLISISFLTAVLILAAFLPPGRYLLLLVGAIFTGFGFAALNAIPWAIVADVVEADELQSGERREGLYSGYLVFLRKLASAFAIFAVGQVLSRTGYVSATTGSVYVQQPASALAAMRVLVTVVPALALSISLILAWRFPIDREKYEAIQAELAARRKVKGQMSPPQQIAEGEQNLL